MTGRCTNCNHCEWFNKNDVWGNRLKLSEQRCECGGKFERVYLVEHNTYKNSKGRLFELTAIGEFRDPPVPSSISTATSDKPDNTVSQKQ